MSWTAKKDKDGEFSLFHQGDVIMRADQKRWVVQIGLNMESGECLGIEDGRKKAEACVIRRLSVPLKSMGRAIACLR